MRAPQPAAVLYAPKPSHETLSTKILRTDAVQRAVIQLALNQQQLHSHFKVYPASVCVCHHHSASS